MEDELEYLSQLIQANRDFQDHLMATMIKMQVQDNARNGTPIDMSMIIKDDHTEQGGGWLPDLQREMLDTINHCKHKIKRYQQAYQRLKREKET